MPATDRYRLALLTAYTGAPPAARKELSDELRHQRQMDKLFVRIEIATLIFIGLVVVAVLVIGIVLLFTGHVIPAAFTLVGDAASTASIALGRSYFIDGPRGKPKAIESGPKSRSGADS